MTSEPPIVVRALSWERWLRPLRGHMVAPAFLLPFIFGFAIHRYLGLSDAMMVAPTAGQPHSILYNLGMLGAFWFGVGGYLLHVLVIAERSPKWIVAKLLTLAVLWAGFILAIQ